jgi:flavin reductase (DIM6/NTAB) family NADH-FMN oxidoreductase RutF
MTETIDSDWIELTEGKQFSRLLYTNPVCFLCTTSSVGECGSVDNGDDQSPSTTTTLPAISTATEDPTKNKRSAASQNVMVLSWLTATNNNGRFMFSLNRRRHSSTLLKSSLSSSSSSSSSEFTLSVPVQGMEELVRSVGSVSGRFGSKFPADYKDVLVGGSASASASSTPCTPGPPKSKRQRKKETRFPTGIPELERVSMGDPDHHQSASGMDSSNHGNDSSHANSHSCFAIQGTVAQLVCRVYRVMSSSPLPSSSDATNEALPSTEADNSDTIIDDDHDLFLAEVIRARVRPDYFDVTHNLFRPTTEDTPPYLTFFGSQTFGYVVSSSSQVK